jgi:hypothetical protein
MEKGRNDKQWFTRHYTENLPMVYRTPYQWYIETPYQGYIKPPTHGMSNPLPMVYRTSSYGILFPYTIGKGFDMP